MFSGMSLAVAQASEPVLRGQRPVLVEIPSARTIAAAGAAVAVAFALYYALRSGGRDEKGARKPVQAGPIAVSLAIAFGLVGGVALNEDFADKSIPIYSYGFMVMTGFAMAILVSGFRAAQAGLDVNVILDLGLWTMVAGILGARVFHFVQFGSHYEGRSLLSFFEVWKGGLVFYGGLLGGSIAGIAFLKARGVGILRVGDVIAPALPLGVAFARFGCFLNGCCFGKECSGDFFLALNEPHGSGVFIHPTQLYESADCFVIFLAAAAYSGLTFRRRVHGEVFFLMLFLYSVQRFLVECLRNDTDPVFGTGLTIGQVVSVAVAALAVPAFAWLMAAKLRGAGSCAFEPAAGGGEALGKGTAGSGQGKKT